jgi:tetratricopeptide (TPR) repeat protein
MKSKEPENKWVRPALALLAAAAVLAVFLPALRNGFLDWDDSANFLENLNFRGLGWAQLRWMFTTFHLGPYQPLSWVTLGADYLAWGLNPFGYHLTNVLLHCLNAALFYFLCLRLLAPAAGKGNEPAGGTELQLAALFAALVFALHPLRVESVAWVTERRDVLSGSFFLLSLLTYLKLHSGGAGAPEAKRRWLPLGAFALALLAKGMAVTLPLALLILDVYPLRRLPGGPGKWSAPGTRAVWLEKAPYFLLAAVFGAVGYFGQAQVGAVGAYSDFGLQARLAQALFGAAFYVQKTLLPLRLLPFYQLHGGYGLLAPRVFVSGVAVAGVTLAAYATRRAWPGVLAAWAYYLITLLPVAGLVKLGSQPAADHYTYLPCLGFAALAGAGLMACRAAGGRLRQAALPVALLLLAALGLLTWRQQRVWHDSEGLWRYALSVDPALDHSHSELGVTLEKLGRPDEAAAEYRAALALNPDNYLAHVQLGKMLAAQGKGAEAAGHMADAFGIKSDDTEDYINQSGVLAAQGRLDEALAHGLAALERNPMNARVHDNVGSILTSMGRLPEAVEHYREALKLDPKFAQAHNNLATALNEQGKFDEAVANYLEAARLKPDYAEPYYNLGQNLAARGRFAEAEGYYRSALKIAPKLAEAHNNLGTALSAQGRLPEAVTEYKAAIKLKPDSPVFHYSLGAVLHKQGSLAAAGAQYEAALKLDPRYAEAWYNLAFVLHAQGKEQQAQAAYRKAVGFKPSLASAR